MPEWTQLTSLHDRPFTTREAVAAGLTSAELHALRDRGVIEEMSRGIWRAADVLPHRTDDLVAVALRCPAGVFWLHTAMWWWRLVDANDDVLHLAVPQGSRRPRIVTPRTVVHAIDRATFEVGRQTIQVAPGRTFAVTDVERTLIDAVRNERIVGGETVREVMRNYRSRFDTPSAVLLDYAERFRVANVIERAFGP